MERRIANLFLADIRLPAIKQVWAQLAEQSDKEGWAGGAHRELALEAHLPSSTSIIC